MAKKMTVEIKKAAKGKGKELHIVIPMIEEVSKSGKSIKIASTSGNIDTGIEYKGHNVKLGLNAYIPNEEDEDDE